MYNILNYLYATWDVYKNKCFQWCSGKKKSGGTAGIRCKAAKNFFTSV